MAANLRWLHATLLLLLILPAAALAQESACECCAVAGEETSAALPNTAEGWLQRAEEKLSATKSVHARVTHHRIDSVGFLDSKETRTGTFVFVSAPARFAVHFQKLVIGRRAQELSQRYIFDGQWLVNRDDAERIFHKQQIVPPNAPAEKADPLASGEGPFFMPLSASKGQVLEKYDVALLPPAEGDAEGTIHLRLKPKTQRRGGVAQIDLWYDVKTMVPIRAETLDDGDFPNQNIVLLEEVQRDQPLEPTALDTTTPEGREWDVQVEQYQE